MHRTRFIARPPSHSWPQRACRTALACALLIFGAAALSASNTKEDQIKAAFLYNFTKFVEWPEESLGAAGEPIVIAIFGDEVFRRELENVVHQRKVNGRSVAVVTVAAADAPPSAHVVFVAAGEEARFETYLARIGAPVLTVGESDRFEASGGMIRFTNAAGKLRFEINVTKAERAGLKISSQLQKLAAAIHR